MFFFIVFSIWALALTHIVLRTQQLLRLKGSIRILLGALILLVGFSYVPARMLLAANPDWRLAGFLTGASALVIGFVAALFFSTCLSLAVGAVALRLRGAYFAIATIGVNEGFRFLIEGAKIWNGAEGMIFTAQLNQILGREIAEKLFLFWADVIVLIIGLMAAIVTLLYMRSKIGYALTALREDEDAAKVMGINVTKYKIIAFITSACFAGLLGASSWALKTPYVFPPEVFEIHYTIEAIIIVLLGGAGTLLGPIVGGLIYGVSKYYLSIYLPGFQLLIFAPIIILIIVMFPEGVVGMLKKKLHGRKPARYIL